MNNKITLTNGDSIDLLKVESITKIYKDDNFNGFWST